MTIYRTPYGWPRERTAELQLRFARLILEGYHLVGTQLFGRYVDNYAQSYHDVAACVRALRKAPDPVVTMRMALAKYELRALREEVFWVEWRRRVDDTGSRTGR